MRVRFDTSQDGYTLTIEPETSDEREALDAAMATAGPDYYRGGMMCTETGDGIVATSESAEFTEYGEGIDIYVITKWRKPEGDI